MKALAHTPVTLKTRWIRSVTSSSDSSAATHFSPSKHQIVREPPIRNHACVFDGAPTNHHDDCSRKSVGVRFFLFLFFSCEKLCCFGFFKTCEKSVLRLDEKKLQDVHIRTLIHTSLLGGAHRPLVLSMICFDGFAES